MNSDILLVATDSAPSNAFTLIQKKIDCAAILGMGRLPKKDEFRQIENAVKTAKVVLIGMSSSRERAEAELFAGMLAIRLGKHVGLYADAPGCYARPWFDAIRSTVSFVSVINEKEALVARNMFPKTVNIVPCGNPDWDKYFFCERTRQEVRARVGITDRQKMIFVSGHKHTMITIPALAMTLHAVRILNDQRIVVLFNAHPDATLPWKECRGAHYAGVPVKLLARTPAEELTDSPFEPTDLSEEELVVGADVVVGECSTAEIGAACRRIPAIAFLTEITLGRNVEVFGSREWEWITAGTSIAVNGEPRALARAIAGLLEPNEEYQKIQEAVFPMPERPGIALERLIALIEQTSKISC